MPETHPEKPLAGTHVVEIGTSVAGPYASWILAALGADVVKVERPEGGDDARQWGGMFPDGTSSTFHYLNNEKSSVTINFKDKTDRRWLRNYCTGKADVVIQNLRPGTINKYHLDAQTLTAQSPRLIYCNLWPFGNKGPLKDQPGYDPLMQALGGIMSVTGEMGRPPVRVGPSIIDMGTGMWCAIGILAALNKRQQTGKGCIVDASLYETSLGWMSSALASMQASGKTPERQGTTARGMAPYQAYKCADGYLIVAAPNDNLFEKLSKVLGHPEWTRDQRFCENMLRYDNLDALNQLMEPVLLTETCDYWRGRFDEAGVPSAPVRDTTQMVADEHTKALGMIQKLDGVAPLQMGLPLSFDNIRPQLKRVAPALGQHNADLKDKS